MPEIIISGEQLAQPRIVLTEDDTMILLEEGARWQAADPINSIDGSGVRNTQFVVLGTLEGSFSGGRGDDRVELGEEGQILGDVRLGGGNDTFLGNSGWLTHGYTVYGGPGNDLITGLGIDHLSGGLGDDALYARDTRYGAHGGATADLIEGGPGNDRIWCDDSDTVYGGAGMDIISIGTLRIEESINRIDLSRQSFSYDTGEEVTGLFCSIEGAEGSGTLIGSGGKNWLHGWWSTNDTLIGGRGADDLIGDLGDDVFVYRSIQDSKPNAPDRILGTDSVDGFEGIGVAGGDLIDVSQIDADVTRAGNQSFVFRTAEEDHGTGSIWQGEIDGEMAVFANVDRDPAPELVIRIFQSSGIMTADDFIL